MNTESLLKNFLAVRVYTHSIIEALSVDQLLAVPDGASNNILWNVGHIIVDGSDMIHMPAGLPMPWPDRFEPLFRAGSSPQDWPSPPDVAEVVAASRKWGTGVVKDYEEGRFAEFDAAKVHSGWPVHSIEETIAYQTIHEGIHLGAILTLRRLVGAYPQKQGNLPIDTDEFG